jgi:hypothetical protein
MDAQSPGLDALQEVGTILGKAIQFALSTVANPVGFSTGGLSGFNSANFRFVFLILRCVLVSNRSAPFYLGAGLINVPCGVGLLQRLLKQVRRKLGSEVIGLFQGNKVGKRSAGPHLSPAPARTHARPAQCSSAARTASSTVTPSLARIASSAGQVGGKSHLTRTAKTLSLPTGPHQAPNRPEQSTNEH